jgi:hypothetical protein
MPFAQPCHIRVIPDEITAVLDDASSTVVPDFETECMFERAPATQRADADRTSW